MNSERMIADEFIKAHPLDAARILDSLEIEDVILFLNDLPPETASNILRYLEPALAARCLEAMEAGRMREIAELLPSEDLSLLMRRISAKKRDEMLEVLPDDAAGRLRLLLRFPEGTAGSYMDPAVFTLPDDISVKDALKRTQKLPDHLIYYIFVLNRDHLLVGFISLRQLMQAQPDTSISAIIQRHPDQLSPYMNRQTILANPGWQEIHVLPVVDDKGVFLGAIGYRTLKRLESEEREKAPAGGSHNVASALGELYWLGLSAFLKGASSLLERKTD